MSLTDVTVSSTARRSIRSFSVWVWVLGAIVLFVSALNTFDNVGIGDDGFGIIGDNEYPWEIENPPVFEANGNTYSGTGSGVIRIPLEEHQQDPYVAHLVSGEYVDLSLTPADELGQPAGDRAWPDDVGDLWDTEDQLLVLPRDGDLELWVRNDGDWEFTLSKTDVDEIENGFASGTSNALLVYRGDAASARFVHKGEGVFFVTIQTLGGESDQPIIESGEVDQRLSWDPTDAVYITIEADDGRGAWSIDIDELATDAPVEPDPDPTTGEPTDPAALPATPASRTAAPRTLRGTP